MSRRGLVWHMSAKCNFRLKRKPVNEMSWATFVFAACLLLLVRKNAHTLTQWRCEKSESL